MAGILFSFAYAVVLFLLSWESQTVWLKVLGFLAAAWMLLATLILSYRRQ